MATQRLRDIVAHDLRTYREDFPGEDLDEEWFTAAFTYERDLGEEEWSDYWAEVQRQASAP